MKSSNWYSIIKQAEARGHGDTLHGERKRRESEALMRDISKLRKKAIANELEEVLPRWRGEARRKILLLPPVDRIHNMSMMELETLTSEVRDIRDYMQRYSSKRMSDILGL